MKLLRVITLTVPLLTGALLARPGEAELTVVTDADGQQGLTVYKMTVTPAPEPVPALVHNFIPRADTLRDGNAALFYVRSFANGILSSAWKDVENEHGEEDVNGTSGSGAWYSIERPLDAATLEKARLASLRFDTIVEQFVKRATVRRDCDWGQQIDELQGLEIIATLLPEVQESRSLARALMLRTRVAVADGDYARAIDHLRMTYQLARNTAKAPFLVSCLVGVAEASMANAETIELIAAKGSPNLYWAIAELPRPFIDLVPSIRFEMTLGLRTFPFLLDPENTEHSPEEWARLLAAGFQDAQQALSSGVNVDEFTAQAAVAGMTVAVYPDAKRRLIAGGMDAQRVEEMPVGQVVAIDAAREYRRVGDEFEKQWYLPYLVAKNQTEATEKQFQGNKLPGGFGRVLAGLLMPAVNSVRDAGMRLDWQLNGIQTVEAIRMHAAETGKLPATLQEITVVPVPLNPLTEKPYAYRLEREQAILELPFSDGIPNAAWRFEITLAK
jgi:hypothetical protein